MSMNFILVSQTLNHHTNASPPLVMRAYSLFIFSLFRDG